MAERLSALQAHLVPGRRGRAGATGLVLAEVRDASLTQITAWPGSLGQAGAAIAELTGVPAAPGPGQSAPCPSGRLLRVEPLQWWLIGRAPLACAGMTTQEAFSTLDLSHARCWLRLSGPAAAAALHHHLPLDLRAAAFPEGRVASSAIHHVGVTLWREEDGFGLLVPRSFAVSVWELLVATGTQYGVDIRPPD